MTLADAAGWIAPAATMIAAMMTAANLGPRFTGYGFVVFVFGSLAWTTIGLSTGQTNLVATNAFLTLVNIVGIWRWLGREAVYKDKADAIARDSVAAPAPTLTPSASLIGATVTGHDGSAIATVVDTMIAHDDHRVRALLVRHGGGVVGVGERLVVLTDDRFSIEPDGVGTGLDADALGRLPEVAA